MQADDMAELTERIGQLWPQQEITQRLLDGLVLTVGAYPLDEVLQALDEMATGLAGGNPREWLPPPGLVQHQIIEIRTQRALVARTLNTPPVSLPEPPEESTQQHGRASFALLRETIDRARQGAPLSDVEIGQEVRRRGLMPNDRDVTYACGECLEGDGWVVTEDGKVRPCSSCRRETFERWQAGHYLPNHSCAKCEELKRTGRRRAS